MANTVKRIEVAGLRRSGNHAILSWIIANSAGLVYFLNNNSISMADAFTTDPHPQIFYKNKISPLLRLKLEVSRGRGATRVRQLFGDQAHQYWGRIRRSLYKKSHVDNLVLSYEDYDLRTVFNETTDRLRDDLFGKPQSKYQVIVLRDPFNLIASRSEKDRISDRMSRVENTSFESICQLWKKYANEYLGNTNYLTKNKVVVNYNRWFVCKDYRRSISEQLGLSGSEEGRSQVSAYYGGGSSFDGVAYNGRAQDMDVLTRYKKFEENPEFRRLFEDAELRELSKKIFGDIGLDCPGA